MPNPFFTEPIAEHIWNSRYRLCTGGHAKEAGVEATWARVALALSRAELGHRNEWRDRFERALSHFRFLPAGRILAGAGTQRRVTLLSCFAAEPAQDSISGIFATLAEAMITMQAGGGIGCDFSTLRPAGQRALDSGNIATGPVSFMRIWEQACATMAAGASHRGAMMAALRCDHPDIERFIDAKREAGALGHFNLFVLVTQAFLAAVEKDEPWPLVFPLDGRSAPAGAKLCERVWSGSTDLQRCVVMNTVSARALWKRLWQAAFDCGDPGVLFIDHIERDNNLYYAETISASGPCGEAPLPSHGACNFGSINLTQFVRDPFGGHPQLDMQGIADIAAVATRMLDNVYEITRFPLQAQENTARASRRIGLGVTGLADAFAMLGVRYGSSASIEIADKIMQTVCHAAYRASVDLVAERGVFPAYRLRRHLESNFIQSLPADIVDAIRHKGIHNSHLTAIAPAGSISLLANNVSAGIDPIHALHADRPVRQGDGSARRMLVHDYAWTVFRARHGEHAPLPDYFVEAADVDPLDQLQLRAAVQRHVDQSMSTAIRLRPDADFTHCHDVYMQACELGLKTCMLSRPGREQAAPASACSPQAEAACP